MRQLAFRQPRTVQHTLHPDSEPLPNLLRARMLYVILRTMFGLRPFIRSGRCSRLLALWIAYSLGIQAIMASVGLGMSAFAAPGPGGFDICVHASAGTSPPAEDRQNPGPAPSCPFCFVAAQSAGYVPLVANAPAFPLYVGQPMATVLDRIGETAFVPHFRRMVGAPRAPPAFSV
jgi:hypothetical protein